MLLARALEGCGAQRASEYRASGVSKCDGPKSEVLQESRPKGSHQLRIVESKRVT